MPLSRNSRQHRGSNASRQLIDIAETGEWNYPGVPSLLNNGLLYVIYGYRLAVLDRRVSKLPFVSPPFLHRSAEVCEIRSFITDEVAKGLVDYTLSSSSSAFASLRSAVSKPSVNRP